MRPAILQNVSRMSRHNGDFSYMILVFSNMKRFLSFFFFLRCGVDSLQCTHNQLLQSQKSLWKFLCPEGRLMSCLLFSVHSINISLGKVLFREGAHWMNSRSLGLFCNWVHFDLLSPETAQVMFEILGWLSNLHVSLSFINKDSLYNAVYA